MITISSILVAISLLILFIKSSNPNFAYSGWFITFFITGIFGLIGFLSCFIAWVEQYRQQISYFLNHY